MPNLKDIYVPPSLPLDQMTGMVPIRRYARIKDGHRPNSGEYNLQQIFARELQFVEENQQYLAYSVATVTRIKKAVDAITDGRIADGITIIRDAKRDDPHNNTLSFLLSQLCYYRSRNGMTEFLPEARNEAKKSCHAAEDANMYMLRLYRYSYVVNEFLFDKPRAIEIMRNYYLLNPEAMLEKDGILTHNGFHLKCWLLLTQIPESSWTDFEYKSLAKVVSSAPAGIFIYINYFKPMFAERLKEDPPENLQPFVELEQRIRQAKANYDAVYNAIQTNFEKTGKLKNEPKYMWTLEHRYLRTFLGAVQPPSFAEVMMHSLSLTTNAKLNLSK